LVVDNVASDQNGGAVDFWSLERLSDNRKRN
jgi:hypothetical protein